MTGVRRAVSVSWPTHDRSTPRRPARLTEAQQAILAQVRRPGSMATVDFSRDAHWSGTSPHRRWSWWETRMGHLLDHELVALVINDHIELT